MPAHAFVCSRGAHEVMAPSGSASLVVRPSSSWLTLTATSSSCQSDPIRSLNYRRPPYSDRPRRQHLTNTAGQGHSVAGPLQARYRWRAETFACECSKVSNAEITGAGSPPTATTR